MVFLIPRLFLNLRLVSFVDLGHLGIGLLAQLGVDLVGMPDSAQSTVRGLDLLRVSILRKQKE